MTTGWAYAAWATNRHRWLALSALALVLGLAGGSVIAVAAAIQRTATAYDRLADETQRYDLSIQDDTNGAPLVDAAATLAGVTAHDRVNVVFGFVGEEDLLVTGGDAGDFGFRMDRPVVVDGRLPDPAADDEILLNELAAENLGLAPGDTVTVNTMSQEQFEAVVFGGQPLDGPPAGPALDLEVVGVGKIPDDLDQPDAASITTPAVIASLDGQAGEFDNLARVRLEDPDEAEAFLAALEEVPGYQPDQVFVTRGEDDGNRVQDATRVESTSTAVLALAAGAALAFVIALVVARSSAGDGAPHRALAACGLDRRARATASALPFVGVAALAALVSALAAVGLSRFFPIGLAGTAEPDPGVVLDVPVLLLGATSLMVIIVAAAAVTAWRASRLAGRSEAAEHLRAKPTAGDSLARALPMGPAAAMGTRLALSTSAGPGSVPARSAILSLLFGAAGVSAVLVFATSLDRLVTTAPLYGVNWDLTVAASEDPSATADLRRTLTEDTRVEDLSLVDVRQVDVPTAEGGEMNVHSVRQIGGDVSPVYLSGRPPSAPDEIALGPLDLSDLGVSAGDTVTLPGTGGAIEVDVVGTVLIPTQDDGAGHGAIMTEDGLAGIERSDGFAAFLVNVVPGTDLGALTEDLGAEVEEPEIPTAIENLARAKGVPRVLAGFLALLGLAGVVHALALTASRRRRDLWTLRALGLRRRQFGSLFAWEAAVIAVVAMVIGAALGVAAGRALWREVAAGLGVVGDPADVTERILGLGLATVVGLGVTGMLIGLASARWIVARPPRQE